MKTTYHREVGEAQDLHSNDKSTHRTNLSAKNLEIYLIKTILVTPKCRQHPARCREATRSQSSSVAAVEGAHNKNIKTRPLGHPESRRKATSLRIGNHSSMRGGRNRRREISLHRCRGGETNLQRCQGGKKRGSSEKCATVGPESCRQVEFGNAGNRRERRHKTCTAIDRRSRGGEDLKVAERRRGRSVKEGPESCKHGELKCASNRRRRQHKAWTVRREAVGDNKLKTRVLKEDGRLRVAEWRQGERNQPSRASTCKAANTCTEAKQRVHTERRSRPPE